MCLLKLIRDYGIAIIVASLVWAVIIFTCLGIESAFEDIQATTISVPIPTDAQMAPLPPQIVASREMPTACVNYWAMPDIKPGPTADEASLRLYRRDWVTPTGPGQMRYDYTYTWIPVDHQFSMRNETLNLYEWTGEEP